MLDDLAAQYLASVEAGTAERKTTSGRPACLIARLLAEGRLTECQFMAGARFREAHHKASRGTTTAHAWPKAMVGRLQPAYRTPDSAATLQHRQAYQAMLGALPPLLAVAALAMIVYDRPPHEYGSRVFQYRNRDGAAAGGLVSLIHAMDLLAEQFPELVL
ncbi:MAG: hypothetical protein FJX68_06845 [Alphaproteobacteria bacterium]|nr:hypothetical protein [Alphaproteobacteria bacterium]